MDKFTMIDKPRRSTFTEYSFGEQVGELIFIKDILSPDFRRRAVFKCRCGKGFEARLDQVISGRKISCGCYRRPRSFESGAKHGGTYTSEYKSWCAMKGRCYNQNDGAFSYYGGRGIKVCERWLNSFENFFKDMGEKPFSNYSIDRIDCNKDYEPLNCRWTDSTTQSRNRRVCFLEFNGVKKTNSEWAAELNISKAVIATRKSRGWAIEDILKPLKN